MGKFFTVAALIVLTLAIAPVAYLSTRQEATFTGKTVLYNPYAAKVKSIDPVTSGDTTSAAMQGHVYEGLYTYHYLKRPVEVTPQVAQAMPEFSEDGRIVTIRLKDGIDYAPNACFGFGENGEPKTRSVTAEDFVLAFKRVADFHLSSPLAWSFLSERIVGLDEYRQACAEYQEGDFSRYDLPVEGLQALDELTFQIKLKQPYPQLIFVLAMHTYAPIPHEIIDYYLTRTRIGPNKRVLTPIGERTAEITKPVEMVGTGPYRLTRWERGSLMVFERNPRYDHGFYPTEGEPGDREAGLLEDAGKPLPFIDVIYSECMVEGLPRWFRFLSMHTDVSAIPPDVFQMVISPDKELVDKWKKRAIRLEKFTSPSVFWLAYNMDDPIVGASKSLRQAMSLSFDVKTYIDVLFNGRGVPAHNILPRSFPAHEKAGRSPYAYYDLERAKEKLAEAREELRNLGLLDSEGRIPAITIDLGGRDQLFRRMGDFIRQQFEPLGLRVKIELNDWPTLLQKVHNKQVQLYTMGWHADYPDPQNFLQNFYGPNIPKGTNNTNYQNPEFDRLYEQASTITELEERIPLYVDMVRILNEDCPILLMSEPISFVLCYDWIENYKRHPITYGTTKYLEIDTEQRKQLKGH
jgi:ABC-type transport system substrate-binding protein